MALTAGSRLGPYTITAPVGAGGMGEVYRAIDTRLDRTVAVKVLPEHVATDPDLKQRFEREAKTLAALSHPHICNIHDVGSQAGIDFLVMEYLDGETLEQRLKKGPLPLDQALQIGIQIADALATAHRAGIVHRDLKPGNIMLTKSGAKLLDFGLAKTGAHAVAGTLSMLPTTPPGQTQPGAILGTFQYMAPEQLEGHEADARTDIFAFGAVLYEMVSGKKAFEGKSQASLIGAILKEQPPPLYTVKPAAPPALDRLVQTCLSKNPEGRWQNTLDLTRELRWIAQSDAPAVSPVRRAGRRLSPSAPAVWTAAVLALAIAVAAAVYFQRRPPPQPETLVRLTLLPPDGVALVPGQPPAVAPDGRRVAIVGTETSGRRLIWIRAFDSQVAYPLPGTDRAAWPFWSPDSRALGFFADGKLMTVDASGSATPITLCGVNIGYGGSWSDRGTILFSPSGTGPLYRIAATGGSPVQVTSLRSDYGEVGHTMPQFVDERHFIFTSQADQTAEGTYLADIEDPSRLPIRLLPTAATFAPAASADDQASILVVRNGTLMAQPFDTRALRVSGEPIAIAQQVASGFTSLLAAFPMVAASRNGVITYLAGGGAQNALTWYDRTGQRLGTLGPPGAYRDPAFSPDGRRLVVARAPDSGAAALDLWLIDVERPTSAPTRLTFDQTDTRMPSWSPNGSTVAFSASGNGAVGAYLKPLTGANAQLLPQDGNTYVFDWSRDGQFLALQLQKGAGRFDVAFMTLADRNIHPLVVSDLDERSPKFSPDGDWITYMANESGVYDVFVRSFPGGNEKFQISTQGGVRSLWSPNGRELFYIGLDGNLMTVPVKTNSGFAFEPPRSLFRTPLDTASLLGNFPYAVSPDGQRFLVVAPLDVSTSISVVLNWTGVLKR